MKSEPAISVITACYNHGRFINEMLASVFSQTFEDYEVIIVNDGSTDDTAEILNRIRHERVKIIHIENSGPSAARNIAIRNSKAPYIFNLDADDKIAPELLSKAYAIINSTPNIGIVYSDAEFFGSKTGKFKLADYSLESMLYDNRIISQSLFRKEDWETVGGYSGELVHDLEDWDFWLLIIELGREVVKIPESLVFYRKYSNPSDCRSGRRLRERMKTLESLAAIFRRHKKSYSMFPDCYAHFLRIEKKLKHENFLIRAILNQRFKLMQKYIWK